MMVAYTSTCHLDKEMDLHKLSGHLLWCADVQNRVAADTPTISNQSDSVLLHLSFQKIPSGKTCAA